jgi:broad specificity phosphatase PhoE
MSTLTIMLIRHGEKPPEKPGDEDFGPGLTEMGVVDKHSLAIRGWQRAGAWAALFGTGVLGTDFPKPDVIYAVDPVTQPAGGGPVGKRAFETIRPLSQRLHIEPVTKYGLGDELPMLEEVRKLTGVVLISWEHKKIGEVMLPELSKGQSLPHLPVKWDGKRFDVVLRFDRAQGAAQWSFRQLFPRLLAGDSDVPM